jgi:hypothetical protein
MHYSLKLSIAVAIILVVAVVLVRGIKPAVAAAANVTVAEACGGDGTVNLFVAWTPPASGVQYVDVSLSDNGFADGTFNSYGPLGPSTANLEWSGISPSTNYYVRVNTLTQNGWESSPTMGFTTRACSPALSPASAAASASPAQYPHFIPPSCRAACAGAVPPPPY